MITCLSCLTEKVDTDFHRDKSRPTGHHPYCKSCRIALEEARRRAKGIPPQNHDPEVTREKRRKSRKARYDANPEHFRAKSRAWHTNNPGHSTARTAAWRAANPDLQRGKGAHETALARARRLRSVPVWADLEAIKAFYLDRPPGEDVDHIIPLNGYTFEGYPICGLHVEGNLQYLDSGANKRKWRTMTEVDMRKVLTLAKHSFTRTPDDEQEDPDAETLHRDRGGKLQRRRP